MIIIQRSNVSRLILFLFFSSLIYSEIYSCRPKANITADLHGEEIVWRSVKQAGVRTLPRDRDYPTGFLSGGNFVKTRH